MPHFRFRLQVVLDAKRRQEKVLAGALADCMAALHREQETLAGLVDTRERAVRSLAAIPHVGASTDVDAAARGFTFADVMDARIAAQRAAVHAAQLEVEEARAALVRCRQDVEMLESLRTRAHAAFERAELRREEKVAGELATVRFVREQAQRVDSAGAAGAGSRLAGPGDPATRASAVHARQHEHP